MKKLLSFLLAAALILSLHSAALSESAAPEKFSNADGFVYILNEDGTAEITGYTGKEKKLSIPAQVDGHDVTAIGARAFYENNQLTEAEIPDTVRSLGNQCFSWCVSLKQVVLPEGLEKIGTNAFYFCKKLTAVSIPASVTNLMEGAFPGCDALAEIALAPDHPTLETVDGVLFNRDTSVLLWYPVPRKGKEYTVPDGTKRIGAQAFDHAGLEKIILPDSVETLPNAAFEGCEKLKTVNIPPKVTAASGIFKQCDRLESISVDEGNEVFASVDGVLFDQVTHTLIKYPCGKKDKTYAIPEGTEAIGHNAFESAPLTGITIPGSVKSIGSNAFLFCKKLKEVVLPEGIETLGSFPFQWCSGLTRADLPASLTQIENNPFPYCDKMTEIVLAENNPALALVNGCLVRKEDMALICIPAAMKTKTLDFPAGIRTVCKMAFGNCTAIEEVIFGDGLEVIEDKAFRQCKKLKRVVLPASVTEIDRTAFDLSEVKNTVFVVTPGSYAENFCASYGLKTESAE